MELNLNDQSKNPPSEQELKAYQENMRKFYDERLPFLRLQAEYHDLIASVSESNVRRIIADNELYKISEEQKKAKQQADAAAEKK